MPTHQRNIIFTFAAILALPLAFIFIMHERDLAHVRALCVRGTHLLYLKEQPLIVSILKTREDRARGLSGKEVLPPDEGMVFAFEADGPQSFWMKDMLFPLDIIFLNSELRIVRIFRDVRPDSYPATVDSPNDTRYALEVTSGFAAKNDLALGAQMRLLSCEESH